MTPLLISFIGVYRSIGHDGYETILFMVMRPFWFGPDRCTLFLVGGEACHLTQAYALVVSQNSIAIEE